MDFELEDDELEFADEATILHAILIELRKLNKSMDDACDKLDNIETNIMLMD